MISDTWFIDLSSRVNKLYLSTLTSFISGLTAGTKKTKNILMLFQWGLQDSIVSGWITSSNLLLPVHNILLPIEHFVETETSKFVHMHGLLSRPIKAQKNWTLTVCTMKFTIRLSYVSYNYETYNNV